MTAAGKQLGVSDSGLRNVCLKHDVPVPRAGHWMKVAHGKAVDTPPLLNPGDDQRILIFGHGGPVETQAMVDARADVLAAIEAAGRGEASPTPIVDKTLAKLAKAKRDSEGLVRSDGPGLIRVAIRPEMVERAGALLRKLVAAAHAAGIELVKTDAGVAWLCDGQIIGFELIEAADQVEHVATAKELAAVEKWKREREDHHRRYGYWRDWGEPKIPKWERRYQGRLRLVLEEVRLQSDTSPWGEPLRGTFTETRKRTLEGLVSRILATVAAMAAAKRSNVAFDERRRLAQAEAARRRLEEEQRRATEAKLDKLLEELLSERADAQSLRGLTEHYRTEALGARGREFVSWADGRLKELGQRLGAQALEDRLKAAGLLEPRVQNRAANLQSSSSNAQSRRRPGSRKHEVSTGTAHHSLRTV
jgi:hypothetical protein